MEAFLGIAERCEFISGDFEDVIARAGDGDVVFCDPPYDPLPGTAGFTRYSGAHFTFEDQIRLVEALVSARSRGAYVVITNSASPKIRELYNLSGFSIHQLAAKRSMSCKGDGRVMAHDIIATLA
jgi:site-specific DNA-adenine methylase